MKTPIKILIHAGIIVLFALFTFIYFSAGKNKTLPQNDISQWEGAAQEGLDYKEKFGKIPLWNSRMFGGMPNYQIVGNTDNLYVTKLYLINLPAPSGSIFYTLLCGYIMLLCFKFNWKYALLGAIGLGFASYNFIIIEAGHNTKALAIAVAPLAIGALALLLRKKYLLGAGLFFVGMALEVMAGHYQITFYLLLILGIWLLSELIFAIKEKEKGFLIHFSIIGTIFITGILVGLGSYASNFLMTREYAKETIRGGTELTIKSPSAGNEDESKDTKEGLSYDYAFGWSQGLGDVLTIFVPNAVGGGSSELLPKNSKFVEEYKASQPGFNVSQTRGLAYFGDLPFTSGPVYFGIITMFLFILAMFVLSPKQKWWTLAIFLLSMIMSMGKNAPFLNDLLYNYLPQYNKFRSPNMSTTMAQLIVLIPGLMALRTIVQVHLNSTSKNEFVYRGYLNIEKSLLYSASITAGIILLIIFAGGGEGNPEVFGGTTPESVIEDRSALVRNDGIRSLFFLAIGFGAIWFFIKNKLKESHVLAILCIAMIVDLWTVDKRYLDNKKFVSKKDFNNTKASPTPADNLILKDTTNFRVYDMSEGNAFNSARSSRFHRSVGGYHAAKLKRMQDIAEFHLMKNNPKVLDMLNAKYYIINDSGNIIPRINENALGNAWFVQNLKIVKNADEEITGLDNFEPANTALVDKRYATIIGQKNTFTNSDSAARIRISSFEPDKIIYTFNSKEEKAVVFSEIYYNSGLGWNAYIDKKPVPHFRCNYILRGLIVPAGEHEITFAFEPKTYVLGNKIQSASNIFALLIFAIGILFSIYQEIKKTKTA